MAAPMPARPTTPPTTPPAMAPVLEWDVEFCTGPVVVTGIVLDDEEIEEDDVVGRVTDPALKALAT